LVSINVTLPQKNNTDDNQPFCPVYDFIITNITGIEEQNGKQLLI
jgi:hypothetical protein